MMSRSSLPPSSSNGHMSELCQRQLRPRKSWEDLVDYVFRKAEGQVRTSRRSKVQSEGA
jgi:hypothetical protein